MRGSVTSLHSFVFIMLPSSILHELIIFFCSLRIYFPTSFSFACFTHCLFFVCSDLLFSVLCLCIFLFFPCLTFYYLCVSFILSLPIFPLHVVQAVYFCSLSFLASFFHPLSRAFRCAFITSVGFSPFCFTLIFFICLFISLRVFPCVFNFFMCLFSAHYLCFLSVFLSPCEALCRPAGHVKISCCKDCSCNIVGRLTTYLVIRYSLFPPSHVCLNPCQSFSPQLRDAFAQYACPLLYAVLDGQYLCFCTHAHTKHKHTPARV